MPSIYDKLTSAFFPQAIAQDVVSLILVSPIWLILAKHALRGSSRAYLLWSGVLTFTVYNYVIYTFSVPFGPLFFFLGCSIRIEPYALIVGECITSIIQLRDYPVLLLELIIPAEVHIELIFAWV